MGPPEASARTASVGFVCGAIGSVAVAALAGFWYEKFPMPDIGRLYESRKKLFVVRNR